MAGLDDKDFVGGIDWTELDRCNPVVALRVFNNGFCEVVRKGGRYYEPAKKPKGANIKIFSKRSRQALARTVHATDTTFLSMMTITVPAVFSRNGKDFKDAQNRFLTWLRYNHTCGYLWFFEFQKRGAPHTHILLSIRYPGKAAHLKFAVAWANALHLDPNQVEYDRDRKYHYYLRERCKIFHQRPEQWENIRDKDGAKKYVLQYAMKPYQKRVPKEYQKVGRFWGCSNSVTKSVKSLGEIKMDKETLKAFLDYIQHSSAKMPYTPKNLYNVTEIREFLPKTPENAKKAP